MGSPALMDAQASQILDQLNAVAAYHYNHVVAGAVADGGTTQSSGASTAPNFDLDVGEIIDATVNGTVLEVAAAADVDSDAGDDVDWTATSGKALIAAVVLLQAGTYVIVPGAVADTGEQVTPTDAEITADADVASSDWVRVADVTFTRTGDTAITVGVDHTVRPSVSTFSGNLAETEAEFQAAS